MKKIVFLMLFASLLFSLPLSEQKFYSYKLFDNEFKAMFPAKPTVLEVPKELLDPKRIEQSIPYEYKKRLTRQEIDEIIANIVKKNHIKAYQYIDKRNKIVITAQSLPTSLKNDIGRYKQSIQEKLDKAIIEGSNADGNTIISFSSKFKKKQNTYIAIYSSSYVMNNQKIYLSTKQIFYKRKVYKWTVQSFSKSDNGIFDEYKKFCQVIE
jgi:hypothetical protein